MASRAIWLDKNSKLSIRTIEESYEPLPNEVLVEVQFSGINPADFKHGSRGFNECVAGYDFAGTVVKAGSDRQSQFKSGEKVLGFGAPALHKPKQYGTHQDFHCARHFIYHVPSNMPMADAGCLMVVTHTAADALFNQLQIPFEPEAGNSQPILIWGASSAVGSAAIQFAKKAGCYPILGTASPKNFSKVLSLGATDCFDYRDPDIVQKIQSAVSKHTTKPLKRVLDSVVSLGEPSSTALCELCVGDATDALFTSPVPAADDGKHHWSRTFACRNVDVDFHLPNGKVLVHKSDQQMQDKIDKATSWAIANYGGDYCLPNVVVVKGAEQGIKTMLDVAAGKASMQKFAIEHPI